MAKWTPDGRSQRTRSSLVLHHMCKLTIGHHVFEAPDVRHGAKKSSSMWALIVKRLIDEI